MADAYGLERFVAAQNQAGTYAVAVEELRAGRKRSHWMWFVFPQIAGLGHSETARLYAIGTLDEARAYLAHPVLGLRLRECARIVTDTEGRSAERMFGSVDAMKLRSSMTLFAAADDDPGENVFRVVLGKYFDGMLDEATMSRLLWPGRREPGGDRVHDHGEAKQPRTQPKTRRRGQPRPLRWPHGCWCPDPVVRAVPALGGGGQGRPDLRRGRPRLH